MDYKKMKKEALIVRLEELEPKLIELKDLEVTKRALKEQREINQELEEKNGLLLQNERNQHRESELKLQSENGQLRQNINMLQEQVKHFQKGAYTFFQALEIEEKTKIFYQDLVKRQYFDLDSQDGGGDE